MRKILIEAEFEDTPIRHAYVTCPECSKKFDVDDARGMRERPFSYASELAWADYRCPVCGAAFGEVMDDEVEIKEVGYPQCAKGAYQKKEVWEMSK